MARLISPARTFNIMKHEPLLGHAGLLQSASSPAPKFERFCRFTAVTPRCRRSSRPWPSRRRPVSTCTSPRCCASKLACSRQPTAQAIKPRLCLSTVWRLPDVNRRELIQADVNGNTTADLSIVLTGTGKDLTAQDFLLKLSDRNCQATGVTTVAPLTEATSWRPTASHCGVTISSPL